MTASLCLNCAAFKEGPWSPCPACGFQPAHPDDLVCALALSEDKSSQEQLREMSRQHRSGEPWKVDPFLVQQCRTQIEEMGMQRIPTEEERQAKRSSLGPMENRSDSLVDSILIPFLLFGIPFLPLEPMGRGLVKLVTLGKCSCSKDIAWMIGLLAYLHWIAGFFLCIAARATR
jgi:hypothetical protein